MLVSPSKQWLQLKSLIDLRNTHCVSIVKSLIVPRLGGHYGHYGMIIQNSSIRNDLDAVIENLDGWHSWTIKRDKESLSLGTWFGLPMWENKQTHRRTDGRTDNQASGYWWILASCRSASWILILSKLWSAWWLPVQSEFFCDLFFHQEIGRIAFILNFSDVTFVYDDGPDNKVNRSILAGRSYFFKGKNKLLDVTEEPARGLESGVHRKSEQWTH